MGNCVIALVTDADEVRAKKKALHYMKNTISNLVETEELYLSCVLDELVNFKTQLAAVLTGQEIDVLFSNVEDLRSLTRCIINELRSAIGNTQQVDIGLSFVEHKFDFTAYAIYCTRLPKAKLYYDSLAENITMVNELTRIEQLANSETAKRNPTLYQPYGIKALLQEPAVRCYKYAELLKGIGKFSSNRSSLEYESIFLAAEVMTDIGQLCNICLRDRENLDVMTVIEANMSNLNMGERGSLLNNSRLSQYGRLRRYGKLDLEYPGSDEKIARICFVFDKILMIAKRHQNYYEYESSIVLDKFSLSAVGAEKLKRKSENKLIIKSLSEMVEKSRTMFYLDAVHSSIVPTSIKFHCEDERRRNEWVSAILSAMGSTKPPGYRADKHRFYLHTFIRAQDCDYCGKLMKGLFWQGYVCSVTNLICHRQCIPPLVCQQLSLVTSERTIEEPIVKDIELPTTIDQSAGRRSLHSQFRPKGDPCCRGRNTDVMCELDRRWGDHTSHNPPSGSSPPARSLLKQAQEAGRLAPGFDLVAQGNSEIKYPVPKPQPTKTSRLKLNPTELMVIPREKHAGLASANDSARTYYYYDTEDKPAQNVVYQRQRDKGLVCCRPRVG